MCVIYMDIKDICRIEDDHMLMLRSEVTENSGYGRTEEDFDRQNDDNLFISLKDLKELLGK